MKSPFCCGRHVLSHNLLSLSKFVLISAKKLKLSKLLLLHTVRIHKDVHTKFQAVSSIIVRVMMIRLTGKFFCATLYTGVDAGPPFGGGGGQLGKIVKT